MSWQEKLENNQVVVIDGGTGSELQRQGVPMNETAWSGLAVHSHPEVVRSVHEAYIAAGAEVLITNTFGTARFLLEPVGLGDEFERINRNAVRLAAEARDASGKDIAIAGSISNLPPGLDDANYPDPDVELAALRELATILADSGADLIALEMMQDTLHAVRAMEAALETGLPVWLGVSCRQRTDGGGLVSFDYPDMDFRRPLDTLIPMGPSVVNIMHSDINVTPQAMAMVRERWPGPIGVYPEVGEFVPPTFHRISTGGNGVTDGGRSMIDGRAGPEAGLRTAERSAATALGRWTFDADATPERLAEHARRWVDGGALLVGGCCGTTPAHIAALAAAFG